MQVHTVELKLGSHIPDQITKNTAQSFTLSRLTRTFLNHLLVGTFDYMQYEYIKVRTH